MKLRQTFKLNPHLGEPPKPVVLPGGFILIQDTREQRPLFTGEDYPGLVKGELTVIQTALPDGDYSIKGFESKFSVERKQISDFYTYIGKERESTRKKMERFKEIVSAGGFAGLIIESSEEDILTGYSMSRLSPEVARAALISFNVRYGIHIYMSRSRDSLRRWLLDRAVKFYKIQREVGE